MYYSYLIMLLTVAGFSQNVPTLADRKEKLLHRYHLRSRNMIHFSLPARGLAPAKANST